MNGFTQGYLTFLLFLSTTPAIAAPSPACASKKAEALKLVGENLSLDADELKELKVQEAKIGDYPLLIAENPDSCGLRGCETAIVGIPCDGAAKVLLLTKGKISFLSSWREFTVKNSGDAVDAIKNPTTHYRFNEQNKEMELIP